MKETWTPQPDSAKHEQVRWPVRKYTLLHWELAESSLLLKAIWPPFGRILQGRRWPSQPYHGKHKLQKMEAIELALLVVQSGDDKADALIVSGEFAHHCPVRAS